jgi:hypothetical protein
VDLVSEFYRPYLELIRFEKVVCLLELTVPNNDQNAAHWDHVDVLAIWLVFTFSAFLSNLISFRAWGLTMAAYSTGLPLNAYCTGLAKCLISAFVIRSSACTINDIFDHKMDVGSVSSGVASTPGDDTSHVLERTKNRFVTSPV